MIHDSQKRALHDGTPAPRGQSTQLAPRRAVEPIRLRATLVIVAVVAAVALLVVGSSSAVVRGAASATGARAPDWMTALMTRSEALNRHYGLGGARSFTGASAPEWLTALVARSQALNRHYGLGG